VSAKVPGGEALATRRREGTRSAPAPTIVFSLPTSHTSRGRRRVRERRQTSPAFGGNWAQSGTRARRPHRQNHRGRRRSRSRGRVWGMCQLGELPPEITLCSGTASFETPHASSPPTRAPARPMPARPGRSHRRDLPQTRPDRLLLFRPAGPARQASGAPGRRRDR